MPGIFISYRREDSQELAGRLFDRLVQRFGKERVFRDIDAIDPGAQFAAVIAERIGGSDALVALIGKGWLDAKDAQGQRRLDLPNDFVRAEIAEALAQNKLVIPVLIEGTPMPSRDALPTEIASLVDRNALPVSDSRFDFDVGRLVSAISKVLARGGSAIASPDQWSWGVRFAVFFACALLLGAIAYPPAVGESLRRFSGLYRAAWAHGDGIPLGGEMVQRLDEVKSHLVLSVTNDVANLRSGILTPWSSAQALVALSAAGDIKESEAAKIVSFMRAGKEQSCGCWRELPTAPGPVCIFISGWILSALAEAGAPAESDEIDYVVNSQSNDGWWAMFPVGQDQREYASSYATALILLGLQAQLERGLLPQGKRDVVATTISRGARWLLSVRGEGSRWHAYPNAPGSKVSESISGLVIHALHRTLRGQTRDVERIWLTHLPTDLPKIEDTDPVFVEVMTGKERVGVDAYVQIRLPWMLVATADSYSSGNLLDRSSALNWLDKVLAQKGVATADVGLANWWRAEFLFSLAEVLRGS